MASLPPHHEDHFPGNAFSGGVPWDTAAPSTLQHSLSQAAPRNHLGSNLGHPSHGLPPPSTDLAVPHIYHDIGINNYIGVVRAAGAGIPAQAQVIAPGPPPVPEMQGHDVLDHAAQHAPAGPAPEAFNAWPDEAPGLGEPAAEILRQLVSRYLHYPGSQIGMFHAEQDPDGGFRVTISLEIRVAGRI